MYAAQQDLAKKYFGEVLPTWESLSWFDKDEWQARADELNEAREDHNA